MLMRSAGNIARAAGAGAAAVDRIVHRVQHGWMLAHAEVVVRAPHGHLVLGAVMMAGSAGEGSRATFQLSEHAVVAVIAQPLDLRAEELLIVHIHLPWFSCP